MKKAFELLDTSHNMTVSKNELRRIITSFLMPLTREQFQDVLAQVQYAQRLRIITQLWGRLGGSVG